MPLGKMNPVTELDDVPQKVRPVAEALEDARHLLAARLCAPKRVDLGHLASSVLIFNQGNLELRVTLTDGHRTDVTGPGGIWQSPAQCFEQINFGRTRVNPGPQGFDTRYAQFYSCHVGWRLRMTRKPAIRPLIPTCRVRVGYASDAHVTGRSIAARGSGLTRASAIPDSSLQNVYGLE
jgi:hypothetical protein